MRILVTAGATWVKIDQVRILTNIFTGRMGMYLAKSLKDKGHSVTLLINPHCLGELKGIKAVYYRYFDEFESALNKILEKNRFDGIIHTAAVSDYRLKRPFKGKVSSGRDFLRLELIPTKKIIKRIRKLAKKTTLIQFKLETDKIGLIKKAYNSLKDNNSDFVVANALEDLKKKYRCFIINKIGKVFEVRSKGGLADHIDKIVRTPKKGH